MTSKQIGSVYERIREILESARVTVARSVNSTQVVANWLIGREIVEEEQRGMQRADYATGLLKGLSEYLRQEFGKGYSVDNLEWFRKFYCEYPSLLPPEKSDALRRISASIPLLVAPGTATEVEKSDALRRKSAPRSPSPMKPRQAASDQSWQPGHLLRTCRGRTTGRCCGWQSPRPAVSTRLRPSKTTGPRGNWNGRPIVCCTSV